MMDFDNILENCIALEHTISLLIKSNATKQADLNRMQIELFEGTQNYLDESVDREKELQCQLEDLKSRKYETETELKQYTLINEKLSEIVTISQKNHDLDDEADMCKYDDIYYSIAETIQEYEKIKSDYAKIVAKIDQLAESCDKDAKDVNNLIRDNSQLVVDIYKNDCTIRLAEQQNHYAEQQFDLVLNQLPWEPLSDKYINELRAHSDQSIRDLAEVLQIQAGDIDELNESIERKKRKKLDILEDLSNELNNFSKKREEARIRTSSVE